MEGPKKENKHDDKKLASYFIPTLTKVLDESLAWLFLYQMNLVFHPCLLLLGEIHPLAEGLCTAYVSWRSEETNYRLN